MNDGAAPGADMGSSSTRHRTDMNNIFVLCIGLRGDWRRTDRRSDAGDRQRKNRNQSDKLTAATRNASERFHSLSSLGLFDDWLEEPAQDLAVCRAPANSKPVLLGRRGAAGRFP
ncbi:hypothetical protein ACE103_06310 [Bradyrhizobium sp. ma5]|uniref:hypothetical protein n=1 Tax=Bradyrhizobium sp. ma5 TaxID=3344828 RepID=UPI0035D4904C